MGSWESWEQGLTWLWELSHVSELWTHLCSTESGIASPYGGHPSCLLLLPALWLEGPTGAQAEWLLEGKGMRGTGRMRLGPALSRLGAPGGGRWGVRASTPALGSSYMPPGGRASPPSICFVAPHRPRSGAMGTPWWPLTATSMCLGVQQTTHCLMSCTATMWTSRLGRSSSPALTARQVLSGTVAVAPEAGLGSCGPGGLGS